MDEYAVPQREVDVKVLLEKGLTLSGQVYVPAVGPDGGPGRLIDQLNQEADEFMALRESQRTHLIHEERILTVAVLEDEVEERVERQLENSHGSRHLLVKLHLTSGAEVIGNLAYVQPHEHERLRDFLNTARRFIAMRVHDRPLYVNRQQITSAFALRGE